MQKSRKNIAAFLCLAGALVCGAAQAKTVTVGPAGWLTTGVGMTQQFTATVTGMTMGDMTLVWAANGTVGGSTAAGTITATGLYTAPATIPANSVVITAALASNTQISGTQYITILAPGPTITAVSPNPIPTGTVTITVTGSGFSKGAVLWQGSTQLSPTSINPTTIVASVYNPSTTTSASFAVKNPSTIFGNSFVVPVAGRTRGGTTGSGGTGSGSGSVAAPVISPLTASVVLGMTQQFAAAGATTWTAALGTVVNGLYTAPAVMPASGQDTVTASNSGGQSTATVSLLSNVTPAITSLSVPSLPLGVFSMTINGTGFVAQTTAMLGASPLNVSSFTATTLTVSGFAPLSGMANVVVSNGSLASQPYPVQVGVPNALVSSSAARRFLEQAAFGPTPADAAHVQTVGFPAWIAEQLAMPQVSNYNGMPFNQSGLPTWFLANAVTNPDQLRQRVAFALSEIFVTSITKLIWNADVIFYQQMLMNDAFTNYRKILGDVTLSPGMGLYLDMANNAKANPAAGTAANENYAREIMQLMSMGDVLLNQDGTIQLDATGAPVPTYLQPNVTELARVFTGWTYAPAPARQAIWGGFITSFGPMVPYPAMHDFGSKTLLNGYVAPANLSPQADLDAALDNIAAHPNTAPFISKQLIQHLVKSNPSPAYVTRVVQAFLQSNGDMPTIISAILLDQEARANDAGGNDQPSDGHLQEPAIFLPAFVRAFNGQMTTGNYYSSTVASLGEDIYNPASVFSYFSPGYTVAGTGGLKGPEFQINNPNATILRENLVALFFNQYSNPIASNGPGTTVDLSPFLSLAATPSTLLDALDLTLTHGTMPAAMKTIILNAVNLDNLGSLHRVQTACYLILTSSYYNVWH